MDSFLIEVWDCEMEAQRAQGTAWLLRPDLAITTFHVAGHPSGLGVWRHEREPALRYRLHGPEGIVLAVPYRYDVDADIALLRLPRPLAAIAALPVDRNAPALNEPWQSVGYPQAEQGKQVALTGRITFIDRSGPAKQCLQLLIDQRPVASWQGMSGAPVCRGGRALGVLGQDTHGNIGWASLAERADAIAADDLCEIEAQLAQYLADSYSTGSQLLKLADDLQWPLAAGGPAELGAAAVKIAVRAVQGGRKCARQLIEDHVAGDQARAVPVPPRLRTWLEGAAPEPVRLQPIERLDLINRVTQELRKRSGSGQVLGVALLAPDGFRARDVVDRVFQRMEEDSGQLLPVRLLPDRCARAADGHYRKLLADLERGLDKQLGPGTARSWLAGAAPAGDSAKDAFAAALCALIAGPLAEQDRILVLFADGLTRLNEEDRRQWGYLMHHAQYYEPGRLKLLTWGDLALYDLVTKYSGDTSAFNSLRKIEIPPLGRGDIEAALDKGPGAASRAAALLRVTGGHPELTRELLEDCPPAALDDDEANLTHRLWRGSHVDRLRHLLRSAPAPVRAALQRLAGGDMALHDFDAEPQLKWLGIIAETNPRCWRWTAPVMRLLAGEVR